MFAEIDLIEQGRPVLPFRFDFVGKKTPGKFGDRNCPTRLSDLGRRVRAAGDRAEQLSRLVARLRRGQWPISPDRVVLLGAAPACPFGTVSDYECPGPVFPDSEGEAGQFAIPVGGGLGRRLVDEFLGEFGNVSLLVLRRE
jgi:hypothetical protein